MEAGDEAVSVEGVEMSDEGGGYQSNGRSKF